MNVAKIAPRFALIAAGALAALAPQAKAVIPNPTAAQVTQARSTGYCADRWVTLAIWFTSGGTRNPQGTGQFGECNVQLYNGGSWSNYDQLVSAVSATQRVTSGLFQMVDNRNGSLTITTNVGGYVACVKTTGRIVSQGGGNIILNGGGNIVAQGGLNIVAAG